MTSDSYDDSPFNHRQYMRGQVHIIAQVREKGYGNHSAQLSDLSRAGCRVVTPMYLNPDNSIFITIPGFAPLEAKIMRHERNEYGCQFVNELHEAIFDHILRTHPAARYRP
jgi:hypothetical protein